MKTLKLFFMLCAITLACKAEGSISFNVKFISSGESDLNLIPLQVKENSYVRFNQPITTSTPIFYPSGWNPIAISNYQDEGFGPSVDSFLLTVPERVSKSESSVIYSSIIVTLYDSGSTNLAPANTYVMAGFPSKTTKEAKDDAAKDPVVNNGVINLHNEHGGGVSTTNDVTIQLAKDSDGSVSFQIKRSDGEISQPISVSALKSTQYPSFTCPIDGNIKACLNKGAQTEI